MGARAVGLRVPEIFAVAVLEVDVGERAVAGSRPVAKTTRSRGWTLRSEILIPQKVMDLIAAIRTLIKS